jgi:hypothetical protein
MNQVINAQTHELSSLGKDPGLQISFITSNLARGAAVKLLFIILKVHRIFLARARSFVIRRLPKD